MEELITYYKEYKAKKNALEFALNTISFDKATIAPKDGHAFTNKMMTILATEQFTHETSDEAYHKIKELTTYDLKPEIKKDVEMTLQLLEENRCIPKDVYSRYIYTVHQSDTAWHQAKEESNYTIFRDHLKNVIEVQKELLSYHPRKDLKGYDILLDRFEKGMNQQRYDNFFETIKEKLLPFIQKVLQSSTIIDDSLLMKDYNVKKQEALSNDICTYFKADKNKTYMCTTEHPFTSFFSANDVRITTHYYENALSSAIYSTIHEYGHALYGLQVNKEYEGTELHNQISFAMHESQSRFLENHVGKHVSFWKANLPTLQQYFPEFNDMKPEELVNMLSKSQASLIRIEADELTYPIHILIRYELEKEIFSSDSIDYDTLQQKWDDKYEQYLGVRATCDSDSILQDVHWSSASFGYFPTYALGSAYAAQFYNTMKQQLNIDELLENNKFDVIANWLKENIHQFGAFKSADEIMKDVTGEAFNPDYYVNYLIDKYSKLYNI